MTHLTIHRQRYDRSRDGGSSNAVGSRVRYGHIPADPRQACRVVRPFLGVPSCLIFTDPPKVAASLPSGARLGRHFGVAHFSIPHARRPALGRLRSRFPGFALPAVQGNRVNSVCCALIGRSHQLYRISDKPGSDLAYPFHSPTSSLSHDNRDNEDRTQNAGISFQGS